MAKPRQVRTPQRQLIHGQPGTRMSRGVYTELSKVPHLHFCINRECRLVYEDYRCADASINGRCHACRDQRRPVWMEARDPRDCCYGNTYVVTDKAELVSYKLAGPGPWFKCRTCARSHGWPCIDSNERNS